MTTWSGFLAELRVDLQDTSATPRWSDKILWVYTRDAIRDYSTWFPRRIDRQEIAKTNGAFPLPSDFVQEIFVESPSETFLKKRTEQPGTRLRTSTTLYTVSGGKLYTDAGGPVYLTYLALHAVPASETDNTFTFTVPDADIELIRLYVKASCYEQMRSKQASLDRFKLSGSRDDNPVEPETHNLMIEYQYKISQRIKGGMIKLYRVGRER